MKRNILNDSGMNPTELDRILASEQPLIPSSGFLASVMESVADVVVTAVSPVRSSFDQAARLRPFRSPGSGLSPALRLSRGSPAGAESASSATEFKLSGRSRWRRRISPRPQFNRSNKRAGWLWLLESRCFPGWCRGGWQGVEDCYKRIALRTRVPHAESPQLLKGHRSLS